MDTDEEYKADRDSEEADKFIPSDVNITQTPTTSSNIIEHLENQEFDLTSAFQRHSELWSKEKQSRLIESLCLRFPSIVHKSIRLPTFPFP